MFAWLLVVSCKLVDREANYISKQRVWEKIRGRCSDTWPESKIRLCNLSCRKQLECECQSSVARGMMQLTEAAWSDVTELHYRQAFEWKTNIEVGMLYLKRLKGMLERVDMFSYPRLAAAYRFGYGALKKEKFMVSRLKTPINRIYRKLFAGEIEPVDPPKWIG